MCCLPLSRIVLLDLLDVSWHAYGVTRAYMVSFRSGLSFELVSVDSILRVWLWLPVSLESYDIVSRSQRLVLEQLGLHLNCLPQLLPLQLDLLHP